MRGFLLQLAAIASAAVSAAIGFVQAANTTISTHLGEMRARGGMDIHGSDLDRLMSDLDFGQKLTLVAGIFALAALIFEGTALFIEIRKHR